MMWFIMITWGFLSSGHVSESNLKAVYRPPNPPPSMHTLGLCNKKESNVSFGNDNKPYFLDFSQND